MNKDNYKLAIYVSLVFYILCLCFPAFYVSETREPNYALTMLAIGWLGPLDGHFSWYANIFYMLALIFFKREGSVPLLILSIMLAFSFLLKSKILRDEGGGTSDITAYGVGYFLWIASIVMLCLARVLYASPHSMKNTIISISVIFSFFLALFIYYFIFSDKSQ